MIWRQRHSWYWSCRLPEWQSFGQSAADWPVFAVGGFVSFVSAYLCVRWLLRYIASHSFVPFAWYRIAFGIVVLATAWTGVVDWAD